MSVLVNGQGKAFLTPDGKAIEAPKGAKFYKSTITPASTLTSLTVNHNLGTKAIAMIIFPHDEYTYFTTEQCVSYLWVFMHNAIMWNEGDNFVKYLDVSRYPTHEIETLPQQPFPTSITGSWVVSGQALLTPIKNGTYFDTKQLAYNSYNISDVTNDSIRFNLKFNAGITMDIYAVDFTGGEYVF